MTPKCTRKRPETRSRTKKSAADETAKTERKKTPKLDAATNLKPVNWFRMETESTSGDKLEPDTPKLILS